MRVVPGKFAGAIKRVAGGSLDAPQCRLVETVNI